MGICRRCRTSAAKQAVGIDLLLWLPLLKRMESREGFSTISSVDTFRRGFPGMRWRLAHGVEAFPIRLPACQLTPIRKTTNRHDHPARALGTRVAKDMKNMVMGFLDRRTQNGLLGL